MTRTVPVKHHTNKELTEYNRRKVREEFEGRKKNGS